MALKKWNYIKQSLKLHKTIVSPYEHQMIISYEFRSSSDIVTRLLELLIFTWKSILCYFEKILKGLGIDNLKTSFKSIDNYH